MQGIRATYVAFKDAEHTQELGSGNRLCKSKRERLVGAGSLGGKTDSKLGIGGICRVQQPGGQDQARAGWAEGSLLPEDSLRWVGVLTPRTWITRGTALLVQAAAWVRWAQADCGTKDMGRVSEQSVARVSVCRPALAVNGEAPRSF